MACRLCAGEPGPGELESLLDTLPILHISKVGIDSIDDHVPADLERSGQQIQRAPPDISAFLLIHDLTGSRMADQRNHLSKVALD